MKNLFGRLDDVLEGVDLLLNAGLDPGGAIFMKQVLFDRLVEFRKKSARLLREVRLVFLDEELGCFAEHGFEFREHLHVVLAASFVDADLLDRLSSIGHK